MEQEQLHWSSSEFQNCSNGAAPELAPEFMKFYILGSTGFLGSRCAKYLKSKGHIVLTKRVEITDFPLLVKTFKQTQPEAVINFTGARAEPNIDWCEDNKETTVRINVLGALNAALAALKSGAYPIQISSGCVYSGGPDTPFTEEDEPNFFGSFYSRARIAMQLALKELPALQARIRMPISVEPHPRNLISKIISYQKVISLPNSATLIEDLFPALEKLAEIKPIGILNLTNDGYIEHSQILEQYKKIINPNHKYALITLEELEGKHGLVKAKRSNCVLSNAKSKSLGLKMPALDKNRLKEIMEIYKLCL